MWQKNRLGRNKRKSLRGANMENNQIKDNVFCIDCHGWQEQIYKGKFKDGGHTYHKYICCLCGSENIVEEKKC